MSGTADSVYQLIASTEADGMEAYALLFAYEGFNPEMVHAHFAKITNEKGIGEKEFIEDMRALITLGAMKGNYTMRNAGKISEQGRAKADALYKKYNMKQGSLGGDRKAIILPRVLSAFPELTTRVILRVPDRNFGAKTTKLPRYMKNPVFPALVPKSLPGPVAQTLLWLYTVYSAEQSLVISQEKDFDTAFEAQKQFVTIAFNSSVPLEATRLKMAKGKLEELVQAVSDHKELKDGQVPSTRASAAEVRKALNEL